MGMLLDRRGTGAVRRIRTVAGEANRRGRFDEVGVIRSPMRVVAARARHTARIHQALHEIVTLHPVLVAGSIGEMSEGRLAGLMLFQLPEIAKILRDVKAYGPIEVLSSDRIREGLTLGMTLNTRIGGTNGTQSGRIDDIR